ncbi:MAG: peptide chain release factor N(5)-glutamine methyltransferase [Woeseiaceae bacterium]|nr:peptide chain release factor N(5)-glutamine methyltransferase [Woeseiaceae bacterium]
MRLDAVISNAVSRLSDRSDSARLDAEILLCQAINKPRSYLFAHPEDELDELTHNRFEKQLQRRIKGEPVSYITGKREFWSHNFLVSPATLIPRPETELLVDLALQMIPHDSDWQILDLGTGSGAIAISIAAERLMCKVTATDISPDALAIAQKNGRQAKLSNLIFLNGDWTTPVIGKSFNIIISNPPYLAEDNEALMELHCEPKKALTSGADGLDDIRILARDCADILIQDGWLMIEHGIDQAHDVANILKAEGWTDIICHNDLSGRPRVTVARQNGK